MQACWLKWIFIEVSQINSLHHPLSASVQVHPIKGNVAFSAANAGWSFTLRSFAQLYVTVYQTPLDVTEMAKRLWGDVYFHSDTRTFRKTPQPGTRQQPRSFVQFVLDPLYKIYSQVRGCQW